MSVGDFRKWTNEIKEAIDAESDDVVGTPITGESLEAGGTNSVGWLSSIRKALSDKLPSSLGIKSGANSLSVVDAQATTVYGTKSLTTTTAAALGTSQTCRAVSVENPTSNLVMVLIGDASSQVKELWPGEERTIVCTNVTQVYAKNYTSTTQSINWSAEVV